MVWNESLIILAVLAVPICVVNVLFVILVYQRQSINELQRALLLSLGCSDFCAGFFAIPFIILGTLVTNDISACKIGIGSYLLNRFIMISSFLHLMAVVFERYLKIVHPFWFQSKEFTLFQSGRIVFALWFTSFVISSAPLTWWPLDTPCEDDDELDRNLEYFDYACLAFFIVLLVGMIYAFVRLFLVVRMHLLDINATAVQLTASTSNLRSQSITSSRSPSLCLAHNNLQCHPAVSSHSLRSESQFSHVSTQSSRRHILLKEAQIVMRFAAMVFMFIISWGICFFTATQEKENGDVPEWALHLVFVIRFVNPLIDPWVLTVNNKDFRPNYNFLRCCDVRKLCHTLVGCLPRKPQSTVLEVNQAVQVHLRREPTGEYVSNV